MFTRIRDRLGQRMKGLQYRLEHAKDGLVNRTTDLLDRIAQTLKRQIEKSGNESNRSHLGMFQSFFDSLRGIVRRMTDKIKQKGASKASIGQREREETDSKTISELNEALAKLDKETKKKYKDI